MGTTELTEIPALVQVVHLFALVLYFGGTFHIVRLFVAHREAMSKWEPDRTVLTKAFSEMQRNALYFVIWPSLIVALAISAWMIYRMPGELMAAFTQVLLGYSAILLLYHAMVHRTYRRAAKNEIQWSAFRLRLFAHGVTLLLFGLVVILLIRERLDWVAGAIGLLVIGGILFMTIASTGKSPAPLEDA